MRNELYDELNNLTLWTAKVANNVLLKPEEYMALLHEVRPINQGVVFPLTFHDKPIFIVMESHPHALLTLQEWIDMGCPKDIDREGGKIGWTSSPYLIRQEKVMSLNPNDCSV